MIQDVTAGRWPGASGFANVGGLRADATGAAVVSAGRDVSGTLSLVTRDGDTVTLSASLDASVTYANVRGVRTAEAQVSRSVSVQVAGDLSARELHDIRRAVQRFLHDLRALAHGGQPSLANVTDLHATTLASVGATSNTQTSVVAVAGVRTSQPAPASMADGDSDSDAAPAARFPARGWPFPQPVAVSIRSTDADPAKD